MLKFPAIAVLAVPLLFATSATAIAQTTGAASQMTISIEQARKIALDKGVTTIREIELDDGKWEIEGMDQSGIKRELDVDARNGNIIKDKRG